MDHRPKCENPNYITLGWKYKIKSCGLGLGKDILDIPEHNQLPKNLITGLHQNVKLLHVKDSIKKWKQKSQTWRKYFKNLSDKRALSRI